MDTADDDEKKRQHVKRLGQYCMRVNRSYFRKFPLTRPQIEGFNEFCDRYLPEVVHENSTVHVCSEKRKRRDVISFDNVTIIKPTCKENDGTRHPVHPDEAVEKKITYQAGVVVDVLHKIEYYQDEEMEKEIIRTENHTYRNIQLFYFPCMVRSKYCHWTRGADKDAANLGAYFIIQGQEKSIIQLQKMRTNFPVTRKISDDKTESEVRSKGDRWRSTSTFKAYAQTMGGGRIRLYAHVPFVQNGTSSIDVPLAAVFKILRVETLEEMAHIIDPDEERQEMVKKALQNKCLDWSREQIIEHIAQHGATTSGRQDKQTKWNYIQHIFQSEFFPHCGVEGTQYMSEKKKTSGQRWSNRIRAHMRAEVPDEKIDEECRTKALYVGFVVNRLLKIHMGELPEDDRDHYNNKRIDSPGPLMAYILRWCFRSFLRQLPKALQKAADGYLSHIDIIKNKAAPLTTQLQVPFRSGSWSMTPGVNNGVVQNVNRINPAATIALGRRVMLTLNKQGKVAAPRHVHTSQEGIICPVETPEGNSCGLMLVLTLFSHITVGVGMDTMIHMIRVSLGENSSCPLIMPIPRSTADIQEYHSIVMVNGRPIGITDRPRALQDCMLEMRRMQDLPYEMRIVWYDAGPLSRYFHINSDCSCIMRPLLRAEKVEEAVAIMTNPSVTIPTLWTMLEKTGCVEYIDKEEEGARGLVIAMRPNHLMRKDRRYTHLQIDETNLLGCLARIVPYSDKNQAPRNMFFTSMFKAALGMPSLDLKRLDMHSYSMWYGARPLASTSFHDYIIELSGGITTASMPVVAIMTLHGRNMEDSVYVNKASLDRGMFMMTYKRTFNCEARQKGTDEETFMVPPDDCVGRKARANYGKLTRSGKYKGIVAPGTQVEDGDVLIGKVCRLPDQEFRGPEAEEVLQDRSIVMRKIGKGVVDAVRFSRRSDGQRIVWVTIRCVRRPVVGDKFASFAAQKGTIGCILSQQDMPFSVSSGITPDLILNPHAIPSRMTIGMIIEAIMSKAACFDGQRRNADSFKGVDLKDPQAVLERYGYERNGKERLMNGMTGEMIEAPIFMCVNAYMRLKHMVKDKIHSRATGPRNALTRQPTDGRSREGGGRFGEMERDSVIAHGAAEVLWGRLVGESDPSRVPICRTCGHIGEHKHSQRFGRGVTNTNMCRFCPPGKEDIDVLTFPHASSLLIRELQAMHISWKTFLKKD